MCSSASHLHLGCISVVSRLYLGRYATLRERREHLRENVLFLDDGLVHTVGHLWGVDFGRAKALVDEWEERQLPTQAVYGLLQERCAPRITS